MRAEIENELGSIKNDLGISKQATESQIQQIRHDITVDNTGQLATLEARLVEINTQIEHMNQRVKLSEQQIRTQNRDQEIRSETMEARIESLADSRVQNCNNQSVTANDNNHNNENIRMSNDGELNTHASILPVAQCSGDVNNCDRVESVPVGNLTASPKFTYTDVVMPKFSDKDTDSPLRYIQELEHFFALRGIPEAFKVSVIRNSLDGKCQEWFDLTVTSDMSYEEFKAQFVQHYWNSSRQASWRWSIINGRYDQRRDGTMVDFYIKLSQRAKHLCPPFSSAELFTHIANQYPNDVRMALLVTRPKSSKEMLELLRELQPTQYTKFPTVEKPRYDNQNNRRDDNNHTGGWAPTRAQNNNTQAENRPNNRSDNYQQGESGNNAGNNTGSAPSQGNAPSKAYNSSPRINSFPRGRGSWNNNYQNRNPRINYIHFQRGNHGNVPHWWRRRTYNNGFYGNQQWRGNNNFRQNNRYVPYSQNNAQYPQNESCNGHPSNNGYDNNINHNNNVQSNQGRNDCPPFNPEVGRLINERNDARNNVNTSFHQGRNNEQSLNN